jgi:hypothetical protein
MASPKCFLTWTLALVSASIIAGCGGSSNQRQPLVGKQWDHLSEQKSCEAFNSDFCLGRYGFALDVQGNVTVGPAPNGTVIGNKISSDELSSLNSVVNAYVATVTSSLHCSPIAIPGVSEQLSITFSDQTTHNVFTFRSNSSGAAETCIAGDQDALNRLDVVLNQLLAKYYPVPFPPG